MEPEARYTLVGITVLLLAGLLAAAVLWLRSTGEGADDLRYKIYFERQSLEGLAVRSDVLMRGIRVGSVSGFRFSERRPEAVEVFITVGRNAPVRTNTQAVVERHLVTGIGSVRLVSPDENAPLLTEAPPGEPYPVIGEGESALAQVSQTVNELASRAAETLARINTVLSDDNQQAIAQGLASVQRVAQQTEQVMARLDATLAAVGDTAGDVRSLSRSVGADAHRLVTRYDELGAQATQSVQEISAAVRKLSADTARLTQSAEALLSSSDAEVQATAQALRQAADALAAAARNFDDPRGVLFGPPQGAFGPGEGAR